MHRMLPLSVCLMAAALLTALPCAIGAAMGTGTDATQSQRLAPRQRILLDEGWRFRLGDPDGDSAPYLYDIRPEADLPDVNMSSTL